MSAGDGLTYGVPAGVEVSVGDRVEVPLGRGNARTGGFVIEVGGAELVSDGFDLAKVKGLLGVTGRGLPATVVELCRWISRYYHAPLGLVLASAMPAAVKETVGRRVETRLALAEVKPDPAPRLTPSAARALEGVEALPGSVWPLSARLLASRVGASNAGPINRLVEAGYLREVVVESVRARDALDSLMERSEPSAPPPLAAQQRAVVDGVDSGGGFSTHLLLGVTGSGKTEVYLRLIERVLEAGKSALVLVPEIALTPQTSGRFLARFGEAGVAVLHSGLSAGRRHREWQRAATGEARVVVGARSALFAPLRDVGLVVVDEEHDSSYKQDSLPRYHGRDAAIRRAQLEGCPVVLGSATPSLESYANALAGRATLWRMTERVAGGRLPTVEIVDMSSHRPDATKPESGAMSAGLVSALKETLSAGGQAILLLNRRGFATCVACPSSACGWMMDCDSCSARMVVHRAGLRPGQRAPRGVVRCHHCLAEMLVPELCPVCERKPIALGLGTQKVEEQLRRGLGLTEDDLARVDSDTMRSARDYFDVLGRFAKGSPSVLLGTQMLAKGLDFPGVRLVGVISADTSLWMPDFRAAERTYQLVSQVAGRAGRADALGRVLVQTLNPGEPAIELAARHDFETFAREELQQRREAGLPPATRMARVVCRDEDAKKAELRAGEIAAWLREQFRGSGLVVDGPTPCVLSKLTGKFRFEVTLVGQTAGEVQRVLTRLRAEVGVVSDGATVVDVDPVGML